MTLRKPSTLQRNPTTQTQNLNPYTLSKVQQLQLNGENSGGFVGNGDFFESNGGKPYILVCC